MSRGALALIDLAALKHNFEQVKTHVGSRKILAMIKANGYGHGLVRVAKTLTQADGFGVASIEEAIALREAGINQTIAVMAGFFEKSELPFVEQFNLDLVIHHDYQIKILEEASFKKAIGLSVKIDSGMHRLGFLPGAFHNAYARLNKLAWVKKPLGLMTHLADADNADATFTQTQLTVFNELTDNLPGCKSISNSAAVLADPRINDDWVRPGIMLYGVSPFATKVGEEFNLKPVMTLKSRLISVKKLSKADALGYGCTWRCPEDMLIGIAAIGYGDGYPRHAQSGTPVLVNDVLCQLVGRVSMDMIAIDLRAVKEAKIGDAVTLWGKGLPIEKVAACAGTIGYELLCDVTKRVKFIEK